MLQPAEFLTLRRVQWALYGALIAALAAIYFHGLAHLLTDVDDAFTFAANEPIDRSFGNFFTLSAQWAGRPTSALFFWLGSVFWGSDPFWFHVLSVAIHSLASFALAMAIYTMGFSRPQSFLSGALFLINVSHFQAVHWISALMYPLYMLFMLGFLVGFLRFINTGKRAWAAGAAVSLVAGVLANVAALSVVLFCLYWQWSRGVPLRVAALRLTPAFVLAAGLALLMISVSAEQVVTSLVVQSMWGDLTASAINAGRNLLLLVSRVFSLAHWVPFPLYEQFHWELYLGGAGLVALAVLILLRQPGLSDGAVWVLIALLPFLPIMLNPDIAQQLPQGPSRYLYAASGGTALVLAWIAESLRKGFDRGLLLYAGFVALLALSSYHAMRKVEGLSYYASARNLTFERKMQAAVTQWERAVAQGGNAVPLTDAYVRLIKNQIARGGDYQSTMSEALQRLPDNHFLEAANRALTAFEGDRSRGETWRLEQEPSQDPNMNAFLAGVFHNLGLRYARQSDSNSSIMASRQALRFEPDRATTLTLLAAQLVEAGRLAELEELFNAASASATNDPEMLVARADILRRSGHPERAVDLLGPAAKWQNNARLFNALAVCQRESGDSEGALESYQVAISTSAEKALLVEARVGLASIMRERGAWQEALHHLIRARDLDPKNANVHYNLGLYHTLMQNHFQAVEAYREAAELNPRKIPSHLGQAESLIDLGRLDDARSVYLRAGDILPDAAIVFQRLGELELKRGNEHGALAAFTRAARLNSDVMDTYLILGEMQSSAGNTGEALKTLALALQREFSSARSSDFARLGIALFDLGAVEQSNTAYKKALLLDENDTTARVNMGWGLYRTGDIAGAIAAYQTVLARQKHSIAQFNLGLAYLALGDATAANAVYAAAIAEYGPEEAERIGADTDLRELASRSKQAEQARDLLHRYWPEP